jgi:hypothetical protein
MRLEDDLLDSIMADLTRILLKYRMLKFLRCSEPPRLHTLEDMIKNVFKEKPEDE